MSDPLDTTAPDFKQRFEERLKQEARNIEDRQIRELADRILRESVYQDDDFNAVLFVDHVLNSFPGDTFITPMNDQGGDVVFRYNPELGIFTDTGIPFIEQSLLQMLDTETKTSHYTQVVKHLQVKTYTPPEDFTENPYMVVMRNGAFNLLSGELEPFSPDHKAKCRIPVTHNPDAKCEIFLKFLNRLFEQKEHIDFIQEWMGYHLLKDYRFQRTVILQGDGDNGKSTLLNVMTAFIGPENVSQESLYRLTTNRFSTAELYGKMGNIAADIGPQELKYTGIVKTLTGNDTITAERKNRDAFSFRNYAKLTFSCNQLPKTPDTTLAFYKRFIPIKTGPPIPLDEQNSELIYELTSETELSGIFNWAYEGLKRAIKRGHLQEPTSVLERKELYENMSDPATGFIREYIFEDNKCMLIKEDLYREFVKYCDQNGFIAPHDTAFYKSLKSQCYVKDTRRNIDKVTTRVFMGIGSTLSTLSTLSSVSNSPINELEKNLIENADIPDNPDKVLDTSYPTAEEYKQDKRLIDLSRAYLKNQGGKCKTEDLVLELRDKGYRFDDFKKLKQYSLIFKVAYGEISLLEGV